MTLQLCLTAHVKWHSREGVADILSVTLSVRDDALLALAGILVSNTEGFGVL